MYRINKSGLALIALLFIGAAAQSADPPPPRPKSAQPGPSLPSKPGGAAKPPAPVLTEIAPVIRGYSHSGPDRPDGNCAARGGSFWVLGNHFGAQAGKGVALGGHGIHVELPVREWHDDAILVTLPNNARIQEGQWYYTGIRRLSPAQWLSNIDKNITVCRTAAGRGRPDLQVVVNGPASADAGDDIGPAIKVVAKNLGTAAAPGTTGSLDSANGYMIDVLLSRNANAPPGLAVYSPNFREDVLLRGGRISRTVDLAPGGSHTYPNLEGGDGRIPADTPSGNYHLCARVDPGNKVEELNETNNVYCAPIQIVGKSPAPATTTSARALLPPVITGYLFVSGDCVSKGGQFKILGRHFGADQGGRSAALGGHDLVILLPIWQWKDEVILATLPNDPRIKEGTSYYAGIRRAGRGEWESNTDKPLPVCRIGSTTDWEIRGGGGFH